MHITNKCKGWKYKEGNTLRNKRWNVSRLIRIKKCPYELSKRICPLNRCTQCRSYNESTQNLGTSFPYSNAEPETTWRCCFELEYFSQCATTSGGKPCDTNPQITMAVEMVANLGTIASYTRPISTAVSSALPYILPARRLYVDPRPIHCLNLNVNSSQSDGTKRTSATVVCTATIWNSIHSWIHMWPLIREQKTHTIRLQVPSETSCSIIVLNGNCNR